MHKHGSLTRRGTPHIGTRAEYDRGVAPLTKNFLCIIFGFANTLRNLGTGCLKAFLA